MKVALVVFCGCLKMRKVQSSTMTPRMQTTAILHASFLARESKALVRMTHNPMRDAPEEEEKLKDRAKKLAAKVLILISSVWITYHRLGSSI